MDDERDIIFIGVNKSLWKEISEQLRGKEIVNYIFPEESMLNLLENL